MATDDKNIETLEEELKLMKGEVKQSLASVRDYLLNMELPSSEFSTILAALGSADTQKVIMQGSLTTEKDASSGEPQQEEIEEAAEEPEEEEAAEELEDEEPLEPESELSPPEDELLGQDEPFGAESETLPEDELVGSEEPFGTESEMLPEDEMVGQDEGLEPEEVFSADEADEQGQLLMPETELPIEEEHQMEHEKINAELLQSTPKVNMVTNLINWVAKAKKEIGCEQMSTFLEVYGISGHLSPELKEVILHLADIASEQPQDTNIADVWSQSMLSLHGILTGGNAPLYPVKPSWSDGEGELQVDEDEVPEEVVDKSEDMPVKLKLVFPNGDGKGKEFCIDLNPAEDNNES
jgi:hypothetical protein